MENQEIRKIYQKIEQLSLVVLLIAIPPFGVVYLYHNSGNLDWGLPSLPDFANGLLVGINIGLLIGQYMIFHKKLKTASEEMSLVEKVKIYAQATTFRFWMLFLISILSTVGLLLDQGAVHILIFAVCLVFFSLAKPSVDRISRLMKLKKEDRELLRETTRPV
ncbi:hypothetical protein [Algoriphagus mannitolivorans]|uniref:hypothetical protein n=1 Tax=Algoriphagus mannitolivorans TaxID=226504 RepID=UPI000414C8BC|nr:hypothetical protein [Algoriphagus mannitolivorans]